MGNQNTRFQEGRRGREAGGERYGRGRGYEEERRDRSEGWSPAGSSSSGRDLGEGSGSLYGDDRGGRSFASEDRSYGGGDQYGGAEGDFRSMNYGGVEGDYRSMHYGGNRGRGLDEGRVRGRGRSEWSGFGDAPGSHGGGGQYGNPPIERGPFRGGSQPSGDSRYGRGMEGGRSGQASMGGFRGKGPKGYTRSDERIKEDISERLSDDDFLDASSISVEVQNGEVTLSGEVSERREKRMAEDLAEECSGVKQVQNNIRIGNGSAASVSMGENSQSGESGGESTLKVSGG